MHRASRIRERLEVVHLVTYGLLPRFGQRGEVCVELHLADVYDPVPSVNERVNLTSADPALLVRTTRPRAHARLDPCDSQGPLDLGNVLETDPPERRSAPRIAARGVREVRPKALAPFASRTNLRWNSTKSSTS